MHEMPAHRWEYHECPRNYEGGIKWIEAIAASISTTKKYERGVVFMYVAADDDSLMGAKIQHSYTELM